MVLQHVSNLSHEYSAFVKLEGGDLTLRELPGHNDVRTTIIYTHVLNRGGRGVRSPADVLARGLEERYRLKTAYHTVKSMTGT